MYKLPFEQKTFRRYFDVTLVTAQLAPTVISKYNTAVQLLLVGTTLGVAALQCSPEILHIMWQVQPKMDKQNQVRCHVLTKIEIVITGMRQERPLCYRGSVTCLLKTHIASCDHVQMKR